MCGAHVAMMCRGDFAVSRVMVGNPPLCGLISVMHGVRRGAAMMVVPVKVYACSQLGVDAGCDCMYCWSVCHYLSLGVARCVVRTWL